MRLKRRPTRVAVLFIAAGLWVGVLFLLAGQSGVESGDLSGRLTRWVLRNTHFLSLSESALDKILRKLAHFGIFAVEGVLLTTAMLEATRGRYAISMIVSELACAGMAVLNELTQTLAVGRSCEVRDMLIDSGGALLGVLVGAAFFWISESIRVRKRYALHRRI